jgi:hypothetical protein
MSSSDRLRAKRSRLRSTSSGGQAGESAVASVEADRTVVTPLPATDDGSYDVPRVVATLEQLVESGALAPEQVRAIVSAATRLYAAASARAGQELPPLGPEVSTTDAVTLACALVRSQDLTPFEMAVWFSRGQRAE